MRAPRWMVHLTALVTTGLGFISYVFFASHYRVLGAIMAAATLMVGVVGHALATYEGAE